MVWEAAATFAMQAVLPAGFIKGDGVATVKGGDTQVETLEITTAARDERKQPRAGR